MSRTLKFSLFGFVLIGAVALGYWLGLQRASTAYGKHFISEAFTREVREAHNDFGLLKALTQNKNDVAFQVAQYRYYSRLLIAHDISEQSPNEISRRLLKDNLIEAQKFQQQHPFKFPAESDQKKWAALLETLQ